MDIFLKWKSHGLTGWVWNKRFFFVIEVSFFFFFLVFLFRERGMGGVLRLIKFYVFTRTR